MSTTKQKKKQKKQNRNRTRSYVVENQDTGKAIAVVATFTEHGAIAAVRRMLPGTRDLDLVARPRE